MKRQSIIKEVDDVFLGPRSVGAFGRNRVDVAVDGGQLRFNGFLLVEGFFEVPVEDVDGVSQMLGILIDFVLLQDERLLDADEIECVLADGFNLGREKRITHLTKNWRSGYC